jgi:DDE family transposase
LICRPDGAPVGFTLLPASWHDLTPLPELTASLPNGAKLFGDKGYVSQPLADFVQAMGGVRLIAHPRDNMQPLAWWDEVELHDQRHTIETVHSQLEKMGVERLHARTNDGLFAKVHASVIALAFTNLD